MTLHPWTDYVICGGLGFGLGAGVLLTLVRVTLHTQPECYLWARIGELLAAEQALIGRAQDQGEQQADDGIGQWAHIVAVRRQEGEQCEHDGQNSEQQGQDIFSLHGT